MSIRARGANAYRQIRSSYWFLPSVLVLCTVIAAQLSLYLDHNRSSVFYVWPESWESTQAAGARATVSVIAQSVLGVVGVMFSVTIVAVSFASGNFGPRLIENFMRDRGTQWSLGILISTFVFALLVLRDIHNADSDIDAFVPHLSVGVSMTMMGFSIMTVIFYVHHIPETINVSNISASLGKRLRLALQDVIDGQQDQIVTLVQRPENDPDHVIPLDQDGYIQTYDKERLSELAEEYDLSIHLVLNVGEFVNAATTVLEVWGKSQLDDDKITELRGCFVVGSMPTEDQNLLFVVDQLVEMTARALSPGVNDPYTAINCLNWMYAGLATASLYKGGLTPSQTERVWSTSLTFEQIFNNGIDKSLDYIKTDALTLEHLRVILCRLESEVNDSSHKAFLRGYVDKLDQL